MKGGTEWLQKQIITQPSTNDGMIQIQLALSHIYLLLVNSSYSIYREYTMQGISQKEKGNDIKYWYQHGLHISDCCVPISWSHEEQPPTQGRLISLYSQNSLYFFLLLDTLYYINVFPVLSLSGSCTWRPSNYCVCQPETCLTWLQNTRKHLCCWSGGRQTMLSFTRIYWIRRG